MPRASPPLSISAAAEAPPAALDAADLRQLCREAGADDVGFVSLDAPALAEERPFIEKAFPATRTLISFVVRMNRDDVRNPARSVANSEFHSAGDDTNAVARRIVRALEDKGMRALNPPMGFPMEISQWPGRLWVVAHKPVAVAAGLGRMGIHRNVIHPRFGNFILLGTVLVAAEVSEHAQPLDFSPCVECKLCVAACPVGAIHADGTFQPGACLTHNYREFMGGFSDWIELIADSRSALAFRKKVTDTETVSMWQSLGTGPNYKAAYCMAVCPAGDEVMPLYKLRKKAFVEEVLRPLQEKIEPIYVIAGSDAEAHVQRRFPHKQVRRIHNGARPRSIAAFERGMPIAFQRTPALGLDAVYHFTFTGAESRDLTITIRNQKLLLEPGHLGEPQLRVVADAETWLGFLAKEKNLAWALLTRRIKLRGNPQWLLAFGRCFPS
jgi:ferredoxin